MMFSIFKFAGILRYVVLGVFILSSKTYAQEYTHYVYMDNLICRKVRPEDIITDYKVLLAIAVVLLLLNSGCKLNSPQEEQTQQEEQTHIPEIALVTDYILTNCSNVYVLNGDELTYYLAEIPGNREEYLSFKPLDKFPPKKAKLSADESKKISEIYKKGVDYKGDVVSVKDGEYCYLYFDKRMVACGTLHMFEDSFHPDFKFILDLFSRKIKMVDLVELYCS